MDKYIGKHYQPPLLSVESVEKYYGSPQSVTKALDQVSFRIRPGEHIAVMGASGSGKTTLLNCISCYIPAESGSIRLGKTELARLDENALAEVRNKQLGFVFQDFLLLDGLTVRQIAEAEGVQHPSIVECLAAAKKKLLEYLKRMV